MSLELNRTKMSVSIYGQKFDLAKPKVSQVKEMQKKFKVEENNLDVMVDYLETLGLPKEITNDMELDHLSELMEFLSGSKKK